MEHHFNGYVISDEQQRIDVQTVLDFLATSYWASRRSPERIKKSLANSICYGVYDQEKMIAFARIITDGATIYHLSDVFVLESYRGQGIAKELIDVITNTPELEWLTGVLGTKDAQGLYDQYGFVSDHETFMKRLPRARQEMN